LQDLKPTKICSLARDAMDGGYPSQSAVKDISRFGGVRNGSRHNPQNIERTLHSWHDRRKRRLCPDAPALNAVLVDFPLLADVQGSIKSRKRKGLAPKAPPKVVTEKVAVLQPWECFWHICNAGLFHKCFIDRDYDESVVVEYWREYHRSPWGPGHSTVGMTDAQLSKVLPMR